MIKAKKKFLFQKIFSLYNIRLLKSHFNSIRIKGENNIFNLKPHIPLIIYANHSNWWDGLIAFYLSYNRWKKDAYVIMEEKQLEKYKFFRKIGAFSIDKSSARKSYDSIIFSIDLLKNSSRTLWMFPQGEMLPNNVRPLKFYNGIFKIINEIQDINIIPFAIKYEFINEQRPEIFINIGENVSFDVMDKNIFTEKLKDILTTDLDYINYCINNGCLDEFKQIFCGRKSRNKIIDKLK